MDDLFGDLPAAKNSAPHNTNASIAAPSTKATAANTLAAPAESSMDDNTKPKQPAQEKTTTSKSKSLVSALGTAGTSMAFVPQALRKKKRPPAAIVSRNEDAKRPCNADNDVVHREKIIIAPTETEGSGSDVNDSNNHNNVPVDNIAIQSSTILHDTDTLEPEDIDETPIADNDDDDEPYLENEPHELRQLHEHAKLPTSNPYNPHTPNDYLAYRERRKTEAVRRDMQAAALAKMEQHEKLRKKVEEERRRLEISGDVDKLVETVKKEQEQQQQRMGGRGRGRGVSNLPAWMVQRDKST